MIGGGNSGGPAPSDWPTALYKAPEPDNDDELESSGERERLDLTVPPPEMPAIGTLAGYDIIGRLAMGGMAEILLARRPDQNNRYVVVKRILDHYREDKRFLDMFLDEARIGMRLRHPSLCPVYECGEADGAHFIAMEWVNGATLGKIVKRAGEQGGVPLRVGLRIIADVAKGLDHAHTAKGDAGEPLKLIHRDVSPHNIMLSFRGEVKLLDFGIAKAEEQMHHTQTGVVKGKFAYMAPEQSMGGSIDHRADIFSLGLCLYEVLSGRPAYKRDNAASTIAAVMSDPMPPLPNDLRDASGGLVHILTVAASKRANGRFATAGLFARALEDYAQAVGGLATNEEMGRYLQGLFPTEFKDGPEIAKPHTPAPGRDGTLQLESLDGLIVKDKPVKPDPGGIREFDLEDEAGYGAVAALLSERPKAPASTNEAAPVAAAAPVRRDPVRRRPTLVKTFLKFAVGALLLAACVNVGVRLWRNFGPTTGEAVVAVSDNPLLQKQGARIVVRSTPPGAEVFLNSKRIGQTPASLTGLQKGTYDVRVKAPGFGTWSQIVRVNLGDTVTLNAQLLSIGELRP